MDIYSFIRSPEVAAHCRHLKKTWNTCEMAAIIDRSAKSLDEKIAAWLELLEQPDMPSMRNYYDIEFDSVHAVIKERIKYDQNILRWLKTPEKDIYYCYYGQLFTEWCDGGICESGIFHTITDALDNIQETYTQEEMPEVTVKRCIIGHAESAIWADCKYDGTVTDVNAYGTDEMLKKWFPEQKRIAHGKTGTKTTDFCTLFFIAIPIPFKRGDILSSTQSRNIFVLDGAYILDNPALYARSVAGEIADGGDLKGWGFFIDKNGTLYSDHTVDYDTFVTCTNELTGKECLLSYVSLFLKNEMRLPELLQMQVKTVLGTVTEQITSISK